MHYYPIVFIFIKVAISIMDLLMLFINLISIDSSKDHLMREDSYQYPKVLYPKEYSFDQLQQPFQ